MSLAIPATLLGAGGPGVIILVVQGEEVGPRIGLEPRKWKQGWADNPGAWVLTHPICLTAPEVKDGGVTLTSLQPRGVHAKAGTLPAPGVVGYPC